MDLVIDGRVVGALGLIVVLTIAPGPDMALIVSTTLSRGRDAALRTALGISSGTVMWAGLSGLGVAALLATSAEAFNALRLAGAAYLVYLGAQAVWEAVTGAGNAANNLGGSSTTGHAGRPYRSGLMTNLLNPKVGLFYTTLVPQLVHEGDPVALVSLLVGVAHAGIGLAWLAILAGAVDRASDVLRRPRVRRVMGAATGVVLVAFGLRVAADRA